MATVEQGAYGGPRPLVQEKPWCRFHHSTELVQPTQAPPSYGAEAQDFDLKVIRSKGAGECNPDQSFVRPHIDPGCALGQGSPDAKLSPAAFPAAGKKVQHNNVVRPGILDKEHSARFDDDQRCWVNDPVYLAKPPPLCHDGAPKPRAAEEGFDTWGWAMEDVDAKQAPSPTRGHEGYGPAPPGSDVRWKSSVSMSGVRIKREAHGVVNHVPSALETAAPPPPGPHDVIPPWATDLNP
eukprot:TRINITY_DN26548_c0_g1_i2.p1 TRINITY_DN26548_c0_g1~~TRINITY_DN26548_c0_g1_i2.p1  ORF type:complete len:238 (+),score=43.47 TRINITY_DN26548_c0_g1_i2:223-936(+)